MINTLEQFRKKPAVKAVNAFMRKPGYIILMAALAAMSGVFALDLWVYSAFIAVAVYLCLLGDDLLPLMPIAIFCYITPSRDNNPGRNPESIFYPEHGGIFLIVLAAIFVVCLIFRLVTDKDIGKKAFFTEKRRLLGGMLILGAVYLLSGIGFENYGDVAVKNLLFAFIQFVSVFAFYYLFTGTVKWERAPKNYLAWIGMCMGFIVLAQLGENYACGRLFETANGSLTINRYNMATGWGMHNNIGGLMAMAIPFCFYLACKEKHGWVYNLLAIVMMVGVVASFSRSSMLMGGIGFAIGAIILLVRYDKGRKNLLIYGVAAVFAVAAVVIFWDKIMALAGKFIENDLFQASDRDTLIGKGWKEFLKNPVFGNTFYPQVHVWDWAELEEFSSFFPPRWHNTVIQLLASAGVVGVAGYAVHRFQTVKLLVTKRSSEKTFIGIYLIVLLGASLLDCHFFNVGPVLFYSMALAFGEKIEQSQV